MTQNVSAAYRPAAGPHQVPPSEPAQRALAQARLVRAEYLVALAEGLLTINDVIDAASTAEGIPLRRISLRQLLTTQPGWGERRAAKVLSVVCSNMDVSDVKGDLTIGWLIDPRAGYRRWLSWLDAHQAKIEGPWAGFPRNKGDL